VKGIQDILEVYTQMAKHSSEFFLYLNQMQYDLNQLAEDAERERKQIKQSGLAAEQRVLDAERQMERAKAKYDVLARELSNARRSLKNSSLRFTLRGPKSIEQFEEDLCHKVNVADEDYQAKVKNARQMRQELMSALRPNAVNSLKSLISQIDTTLKKQMHELGTYYL